MRLCQNDIPRDEIVTIILVEKFVGCVEGYCLLPASHH